MPTAPLHRRLQQRAARNPARLVVLAFLVAVLIGTALLCLPGTTASGERPPLVTALFTATSAVCVTGLIAVNTADYWSTFGHALILGLIQIGGFGIMTLSSLLVLVLGRRMGVSRTLLAQTEHKTVDVADVRRVLFGVLGFSLLIELVTAVVLTGLFLEERPWGEALWFGVFHSVAAFNNAGFDLFGDSLQGFATDPLVLGTITLAVFVGSLGFPVLVELLRRRGREPRHWTLHTKLTLVATTLLVVLGAVALLATEWGNDQTFGRYGLGLRVVHAVMASVMPRSGGFSAFDYGEATEETLVVTVILMFIGGGSASTAGGIKVTTWALVGLVVWAEVRGERHVQTLGRRVADRAQRQALAVIVIAITGTMIGAFAFIGPGIGFLDALFEATSAFATVGLSTGVTSEVPAPSQVLESALMLAGRVGPATLATALALRETHRRYRYAEETPLIG